MFPTEKNGKVLGSGIRLDGSRPGFSAMPTGEITPNMKKTPSELKPSQGDHQK